MRLSIAETQYYNFLLVLVVGNGLLRSLSGAKVGPSTEFGMPAKMSPKMQNGAPCSTRAA